MSEKKSLLVLGGKPIGSINVVEQAKAMGLYTIVTDYLEPQRSPAKLIADEAWDISTADIEKLEQMIMKNNVNGIFTGVHEFNIRKMMTLCEHLSLPCYCSTQQWNRLENKENFKKLCAEYGLPITPYYDYEYIRSTGDTSNVEFPVITKPVDGSGSRGFSVCNNAEELMTAIEKALSFSETGKVLIEKCMDYKTSVIINYTVINKQVYFSGISDKYSAKITETGGPIMSFQYYPSLYEKTYLETLDDKAKKMIESLGFDAGVVWIEAFNDNGKFTFNELGLRFGGSLTYLPVQHFYGFSQLDVLMEYAVKGCNSQYSPKRICSDDVYCIFPVHVKPGVISKIIGMDKLEASKELVKVVPVHYTGDTIEMWNSAQQVFAYIHYVCTSREKAKEFAKWIMNTLRIEDENGEQMLFNLYI